MQIRRLEIFGFKSFKNRTVLEFNNDGITGVVGPNGCGKSNIVDALLWVMGETSPKNLRSTSLSDVIFSGTNKQSPSGIAEVSLTLSQGTNGFPEKYKHFTELMITRKSFRDGKTDYFINQQACLLRDIKEIFMDTGAGCKGFSIIEQESVEKLITAKPQERRFIIEEVAGITKFKSRKSESTRKLELVHQNLKRLEDILKTQEKQLNHLSSQAKQAEKYRNLKKDIRTREIEILYRYYKVIQKEQEDFHQSFLNQQERKEQLEKTIIEKQDFLKNIEQDIQTQNTSLEKDKNYCTELNYKILERKKEIESLEKAIEFHQARLERQKNSEQAYSKDIENSELKVKEIKIKKADLIQEEENLKNQLLEIENFLSQKEDSSYLLEQKNLKKLALQKTTKDHLDKTSQIQGLQKQLEVLSKEQDKLKVDIDKTEDDIQKCIRSKNSTAALLQKNQQMKLSFDKEKTTIQQNKIQLEKKTSLLDQEVRELIQETSLLKYKIEELDKLIHQFENFKEGSLYLLSWKPELFNPFFKDLKIEDGFEKSLSVVLGSYVQAVIPKDKTSIEEGIKELKAAKKGKASFISSLPTNTSPLISTEVLNKYPTFICYLEEKIYFTLETEPLKKVIRGTAVVSNLKDGLELKEKFPSLQIVTKEGDLITKESIVHGGSSEKDTSLFQLYKQVEKNLKQLNSQKTVLEFKKVDLEKTKEQLSSMESALETHQNKIQNNSENLISLNKDLESLKKDLLRFTELKSNSQKYWENFENEKEDIIHHLSSHEEEAQSINRIIEQQKVDLKNLELTEDLYKKEENKKSELEMKIFQNSKEQSGLEQEINLMSEFIEKSQEKMKKDTNNEEVLKFIEEERNQIQEIRKELELFLEEKSQVEAGISSSQKAQEKNQVLKTDGTEKLNETKNQLTQVAIDKKTYEAEQEKLELKKQNLEEKLYENHQINIKEYHFVAQYENLSLDKLRSDLENLQEKLQKIPSVNLLALTEYEELSKSHNFLNLQKDDLINSKKELNKVIIHIDHVCEKRFKDMLEEINLRFSKVFPIIFEGDNAEAHLILKEDPETIEPGIDIIVRPPGKRPQSVTLLSKGEKALTAICLIYSLFLVKPSPFCVVDEIDSPLDDANIFRLISVLKEMSRKSQIIAITHNKYTMKACKKLYGVTMEQPGVSQLVSVDMTPKQDLLDGEIIQD
ncbi:MAG: chromosome segregation protein SMC [Bdellovibrionales bacterium]